MKLLVVGAGFAGAIMAERAHASGFDVRVVDRRKHIGGNAYDEYDRHGVRVHRYGPHLFHTNAESVIDYLSRFTDWWPYEHRVRARVDGKVLPIPINRTTLEGFFDVELRTDAEAERLLNEKRVRYPAPKNSEQVCLDRVGPDLYEAFFRWYTQKQWGRSPAELDPGVCGRIPVRTSRDDRYFTDRFQRMPKLGYATMFEQMLKGVDVRLGEEGRPHEQWADHVIWTGPLDEAYDYRLGRLPWRSLRFELLAMAVGKRLKLPTATLNDPGPDKPWTRTTEYPHLTGQRPEGWTALQREYPLEDGEPYYPVPAPESKALFREYQQLARLDSFRTFVGRLARYQYLEMGQVVAQALKAADELVGARA